MSASSTPGRTTFAQRPQSAARAKLSPRGVAALPGPARASQPSMLPPPSLMTDSAKALATVPAPTFAPVLQSARSLSCGASSGGRPATASGRRGSLFSQICTNQDGVITRAEFNEARRAGLVYEGSAASAEPWVPVMASSRASGGTVELLRWTEPRGVLSTAAAAECAVTLDCRFGDGPGFATAEGVGSSTGVPIVRRLPAQSQPLEATVTTTRIIPSVVRASSNPPVGFRTPAQHAGMMDTPTQVVFPAAAAAAVESAGGSLAVPPGGPSWLTPTTVTRPHQFHMQPPQNIVFPFDGNAQAAAAHGGIPVMTAAGDFVSAESLAGSAGGTRPHSDIMPTRTSIPVPPPMLFTGENPVSMLAEPSPSFGGSPSHWAGISTPLASSPLHQQLPALVPLASSPLYQQMPALEVLGQPQVGAWAAGAAVPFVAPEGVNSWTTSSTLPPTAPGVPYEAQRDFATSESSMEQVLPGEADASQGAFLCEVAVVGAELPHLLDPRDFQSVVSFTSFSQANAQIMSQKPHRFVVHSREALATSFVHILLRPCDADGSVTLELEAFFPLPHAIERFGYGQVNSIYLGLLPRGSGASPDSIFQHCARLGASGIDAGGAAGSRVFLNCSVIEKPGSLWRSEPDLARLVAGQWPSPLPQGGSTDEVSPNEEEEAASGTCTPPESSSAPGPCHQAHTCESGSPARSGGRGPGSPMTDGGWDEEQEQEYLQEELKKARNELRMQQTLMKFQERRLQVFEAQSNAIAAVGAAGAASPDAYDANMNFGVQDQIRQMQDQMQMQQDEICRLRDQAQFQPPSRGPWQQRQQTPAPQLQAQQPQQQWRQQGEQAREIQMNRELMAREQRIAELERALQERDQQLDMIPDAVDSILRSPPNPLEVAPLMEPNGVPHAAYRGSPMDAMFSGFRTSPLASQFPQEVLLPSMTYGGFQMPFEAPGRQSEAEQAYLSATHGIRGMSAGYAMEAAAVAVSQAQSSHGLQDGMVHAFQQSAHALDNMVGARYPPQQYRNMQQAAGPMHGSACADETHGNSSTSGHDGMRATAAMQHVSEDVSVSLGDRHFQSYSSAPAQIAESFEVSYDSASISLGVDANISQQSCVKITRPPASQLDPVAESDLPSPQGVHAIPSGPPVMNLQSAPLELSRPVTEGTILSPSESVSALSNGAAILQYVPVEPDDSLEIVVAECMAYLSIPQRALGYAALHREAPGVYSLGGDRFVLRQLDDGGIYMQHGTQWIPFDAWLLQEARRHMSELSRQHEQEQEQLAGAQGLTLEPNREADAQAWQQQPLETATSSPYSNLTAQPAPQADVTKEPESPASSAKRSLVFSGSPEGAAKDKGMDSRVQQKANVEIDLRFDISADSMGTTAKKTECHGPISPTASTADVHSASCRSTNDVHNF